MTLDYKWHLPCDSMTLERRFRREGGLMAEWIEAQEHAEGRVARAIERQTAKLPSDTFLWTAVGAMALSAGLQLAGNRQVSNFVGQWAPTLLIFGLYNKLVKQLGSDRLAA